jgi:hypothetical protein
MSTLHFEGMTEHRTTVRIPADLLLRAKTKAAEEDRTLTSLIEEGLRIVVAEPRRSVTNKRILPRISKSSGGPLPGIDISKSARLQEMDDLEYVARMKRAK